MNLYWYIDLMFCFRFIYCVIFRCLYSMISKASDPFAFRLYLKCILDDFQMHMFNGFHGFSSLACRQYMRWIPDSEMRIMQHGTLLCWKSDNDSKALFLISLNFSCVNHKPLRSIKRYIHNKVHTVLSNVSLLANSSTAFIWKLCCHWLKVWHLIAQHLLNVSLLANGNTAFKWKPCCY